MYETADHSLTPEDIRSFFNRFGWLLPIANALDAAVYRLLVARGRFAAVRSVLDVGAGSGHLVRLLLCGHLPDHAVVTLVEVAPSLGRVLRSRFATFGDRVAVEVVGLSAPLPFADESFERVVSCYVLDTMNRREIRSLVEELYRVLNQNGLLCIVVTAPGVTVVSRMLARICAWLFAIDPRLVGVSRPIDLMWAFPDRTWELLSRDRVTDCGFSSEVMILKKGSADRF